MDDPSALDYVTTFAVFSIVAAGFCLLGAALVALVVSSEAAVGMLMAGAVALGAGFGVGWIGGAQALDELPEWARWTARGIGAVVAAVAALACVVTARRLK